MGRFFLDQMCCIVVYLWQRNIDATRERGPIAMTRLLFIVPYPQLKETVDYVLSNYPGRRELDVEVQVYTAEDLPRINSSRYDAVIARGYTAKKIAAIYRHLPVVRLNISGYDVVRALSQCCQTYHPNKVAVFTSEGQMYQVEEICRLFGVEGEVYAAPRHDKLSTMLDRAMEQGCDALIGGYSAVTLARQRGFPGVVIGTGEDTVLRTIETAVRTVGQLRRQQETAQMYKTIICSSKDGVLYVDAHGVIQVQNQVICQMHGVEELMGRPLQQALPYLYKMFCQVLSSGQEEVGRVLAVPGGKMKVSASCTPVVVNGQISGAVMNLTDITLVQNLESQIRRKLSERGLRAKYHFSDIVHHSAVIEQTIQRARQYALSNSNIIIVGETGTGKELFAQSIHNTSSRKNGPFVAINCAAITENLLESELFGYVEGAFTGTSKGGKMGLFEQAHGGTLFLDEVEEISLSTQSKLLRVLQERQGRRIGDNKVIDVDVRIISATNKSIASLSQQGKFRKDLMYRLDVLRLFIPPLREREDDVELLFLSLLKEQCAQSGMPVPRLDPEAIPLLHQYPFEGNIRELKNVVERVSVGGAQGVISPQVLREAIYPRDLDPGASSPSVQLGESSPPVLDEHTRLLQALEACGGNRTQAAKMLGMDRSTLWRKLQKYEK